MKHSSLTTRPGWAALLFSILTLALPLTANADDRGDFENPKVAFTWYSKGPGCLHFKLQTTNSDPYRTLHTATYGLRDAAGEKTALFHVAEQNSDNGGYVRSLFTNYLPNISALYLTNDTKYKPLCFIDGGTAQQHDATRNNNDNGYAELDWYYPVKFAGKKFTFYVEATLWYKGGKTEAYNHDIGTIEFDEISLETYDAFPATGAGEEGMIKIPFVSNHVINSVQVRYTDEFNTKRTLDRVTLDKDAYSGFVTVPATAVHKDLTLTANVVSGKPSEGDVPNPDWMRTVTGDVSITLAKAPMMHAPHLLTAELQVDSTQHAKMVLKWQTEFNEHDDLLDGDMFLVQRSLTGRIEDFTDIGSEAYDSKTTNYTFEDESLINALTPELIDAEVGIPLVRYRVMRASTRELWGTYRNPTISHVMPRLKTLELLKPINIRADWKNQEQHKARVKWDYDNSGDHHEYSADTRNCIRFWDDRAQMTVVTRMYNRNGQLVDTLSREVTSAERLAGELELTLNRSCVNYDVQLVVDANKSPIGHATGDLLVKIKSQDDWVAFANRVSKGETTLNAILLTSSVRITTTGQMIGTADNPYRGIFLGNTQETRLDITTDTENNIAPFRYIADNATISHFFVHTTISTSMKYAGGIAARLQSGNAYIEYCEVDMNLRARLNGDGSHGGLVAGIHDGQNLYISNCLVRGSFDGSLCYNNGGFVGWLNKAAFVVADRCFFNPEKVEFAPNSILFDRISYTLVRTNATAEVSAIIRDCYYSKPMGIAQGVQASKVPASWGWVNDTYPSYYPYSFPPSPSHGEFTASLPTDKLYYVNHGKIDAGTLKVTPLRSSALLEWSTDGGTVDYFDVYRIKADDPNPDNWERIATQVISTQYEDKKTSPVYTYKYKVLSANDCEGTTYETSKVVTGGCEQTCTLEGYVVFPDGTGIPNRPITITEDRSGGKTYQGKTDVRGHFIVKDLPYWGGSDGRYRVSPIIPGYTGMQSVSFGTEPGQNYISNVRFEVTDNVKFSGYVQYNGTSIPVQGVRFLVDGYEVGNAAGPIESDHEGKFAFRMLPGNHNIQAVKDGHQFLDDGYYYADELNKLTTEYDFQTDKAGIYFYDKTRVRLIGRVAGGKDQGSLPLGNSLSRNNLGDDLEMVFVLEGDNTSRLVWDILDRKKAERDETFVHKAHDKKYTYMTQVHTTAHRMVVRPDVHTGEYEVLLPPVKWKIQQITAKGYPTLFQEGTINDVIDLTDSLAPRSNTITGSWKNANGDDVTQVTEEYHAKYSRIYHSPVLLERQQIGYDKFSYFGDKSYTAKNLQGDKVTVPLAYGTEVKSGSGKTKYETHYTFGYPVFNINREYPVKISAIEKYYYNNNPKNDTVDVIKLSGGVVTIQNSMVSATHRDTVHLDDQGERIYLMTAKQTPYSLTGDDALRTVTMTLEMDGTHYEAEPLRAYVLNTYVKPGAKDLLSINQPQLVDILRDPPGGGSSAKLSKGSTLKYGYNFDWSAKGGLTLGIKIGTDFNQYVGVIMGMTAETGIINNGSSKFSFDVDLMFSGAGKQAYSYTMTANSDISTSSDKTMVGADADVYIGTETNFVVTPAVAIRAIDETMWQQLEGARQAGNLVEIARGTADGKTVHLVRDEVLTMGPRINSTFVHSQSYILTQLIPNLEQQCKALLFTGTKEEAQKVADATGKVVYWSLRSHDDENYGVVNTREEVSMGDSSWEYYYNTTIDKAEEGINYMIVNPTGADPNVREDRIGDFCQSALWWAEMIARNEREKLSATKLLRNFDIDGGAPVSYSEDFTADIAYTSQVHYFWQSMPTNIVANAVGWLIKLLKKKQNKNPNQNNDQDNILHGRINWAGTSWEWDVTPAASYNYDNPHNQETKYNRKESFTISMDKRSHLDFDVYAVQNDFEDGSAGTFEVFSNKNFDKQYDKLADEIPFSTALVDIDKVKKSDLIYPRGFVYRTRGGATCRPYEGERKSVFYRSGTVLDEATRRIENPIIKIDKQSISGVPFGEPARFKLYMTNESEVPEAAYPYFDLYLVEKSNPKGAKLMIDGMPLSGNARTMEVRPGQVTEKTLEVYASEDFDYENLRLSLISQGDMKTNQEVQFSVHFLQGAGPVAISMPGDKWIMNTDAAYDKERGWHMPVIISGFNKTQKNFDHIEFQYKESNRGDDFWTNLCAFYADSTYYRNASGTKAMIPENGNIITDFYGEGVVMEKAYDLRAVLFCRNGNGYLTSSSAVLSGIKDTRRPQLFGTPEPKDGILGAGDNVVFNFSEPIEHNYLRETTNFEVKGETNETSIQEEPSLYFGGEGYAQSEARRNFADKDLTVEVLIKPDATDIDMPIFSHGTDGKQLQLWLTKERRLRAVVDDKTLTLNHTLSINGFQQVALALDNAQKRLTLYADTVSTSLDSVSYSGYGAIIFGSTNQADVTKRKHFKGRMLQGRVWNRVLDKTLLNYYGYKTLTGYEMGLTDYYPMNEGDGDFAIDQAQGAHLTLTGTSWSQPRGMSLRLDWDEQRQVKGLKLKPTYFSRTSEQDYTLMFWFRTNVNGRGALLSNGSGRKTDVAPEDKFFIGFEADTLKYRANGMEYKLGNTFSDDRWHYYAMTVNRAHQVASIYIDNVLKAQFSTENLGGMTGDDFYLGNMVWHEQGLNSDVLHQYNALTGNIDGICLFEQALPTALIKRYGTKAIGGSEKGLVTYLNFDQQERQKNGDIVLRPYALSQKIHYDLDGKEKEERDTVFVDSPDFIRQHIDQNLGAPLQAYEELRNLNFSYVGRDNQLLVNIDELDARINKRTVYVTTYDVPDLNGNYTASPATVAVFVDRNPLRWEQKTYRTIMAYNQEADFTFSLKVVNNSGAPHTYTIENLPKWLSVETLQDVVEPKAEQWVDFSINKDTNVGEYDQIIYLTDENGLSEPLMINVTVEGKTPGWTVDPNMKQYSMSIVGRVQIGDDIVTDSRDIVAVFDSLGKCIGVSNVNYDPVSAETMVYLSVFSDNSQGFSDLQFKLWHYATGKVMALQPSQSVQFSANGTIGTTKKPIVLQAGSMYIQTIELAKGWNWVSFNVNNPDFRDGVNMLLGKYYWQEGDILVDETNSLLLVYKDGGWLCNITDMENGQSKLEMATNSLNNSNSYRIKVASEVVMELTGTCLKQPSERIIQVKHGWNHIGYTPMVNLSVTTALADYFSNATDGDVVKNKTEFAMFTTGANGSGEWKGNLKYMKPGEGYMLKRQAAGTVTFKYPYYEPTATIVENAASRQTRAETRAFANTMSLAAVTDGVSLQPGDRLIALAEAEIRGEGEVADADSVVYMSISGEGNEPLSFAIEREGEIIATTADVMTYQPNAVSGSPLEPTHISFVPMAPVAQEGWYTLQGVRLQSKPVKGGVYIYNGHKRIIK